MLNGWHVVMCVHGWRPLFLFSRFLPSAPHRPLFEEEIRHPARIELYYLYPLRFHRPGLGAGLPPTITQWMHANQFHQHLLVARQIKSVPL